MAPNDYKVETYLHKEKDRDLLRYIEELPHCLRQKYLREALTYYRMQLENPGLPVTPGQPSGETEPKAGGVKVLKKVSL